MALLRAGDAAARPEQGAGGGRRSGRSVGRSTKANLASDPARAAWVPLLQYHHGVALKEAGKLAEARTSSIRPSSQGRRPARGGEAALRWGQCLQGRRAARRSRRRARSWRPPNLKPGESPPPTRLSTKGCKDVRDAVAYLEAQADAAEGRQPPVEARARMLYEAAWGNRTLAELEVDAVRTKLQQDQLAEAARTRSAKKTPPGQHAAGRAAAGGAAGRRAACSRPSRRLGPTTRR